MKSNAISRKYGFDRVKFVKYIEENTSFKVSDWSGEAIIPDEEVEQTARAYQSYLEGIKASEEAEKQAAEERKIEEEKAEQEKQRALAQMLITSGFTFDGYKIVKYSGYISGDDVVQLPREIKFFAGTSSSTSVGEELTNALVKIRRQALKELKEAAYALGCNAVIGVDFDYITLEPETSNIGGNTVYLPFVFCVTANGNAVVIEKISE